MMYQKQKQKTKINIKTAIKILVFLIIVQGVFYMASVNDLMVKGFRLQELKTASNIITRENKNHSIRATSLQSYNNLIKRVDVLDMVVANDIRYIKANKGSLASR